MEPRAARRGALGGVDRGHQRDGQAVATWREELCSIKSVPKKNASPLSGGVNQRFHVVQVALQRAPPGGGEPILGLRYPPLERLAAGDVLRLLEPARVHAQVAVRGLEQRLELVEAQRIEEAQYITCSKSFEGRIQIGRAHV